MSYFFLYPVKSGARRAYKPETQRSVSLSPGDIYEDVCLAICFFLRAEKEEEIIFFVFCFFSLREPCFLFLKIQVWARGFPRAAIILSRFFVFVFYDIQKKYRVYRVYIYIYIGVAGCCGGGGGNLLPHACAHAAFTRILRD
eukprot:GEMP01064778.1.p1 GENE.GEMP01064778.1~~GEMP01064778.1.p1  ORF type:complete len:142 (+),score=1.52 GEMP01064778.1:615-1040(+)